VKRDSSAHPPEIAVLEDAKGFAALEEEWENLYHNAPLATPFQSWAWLYSWWEFYGEGYDLRLITVRSEGLLVGIVPLMLKRRWGFGRLLFVGTGITDYLDMLAREGWEDYVSEAAREALWRMGSWHVAELHELRPKAAAWGVFEGWSGPRTRVHQTNCPVIEAKPWDELLMSFKRKIRYDIRRNVRRADEDGIRCELVGPADAERAARRLVALNLEQWEERGISPEALTRRFEAHLEAVASRMTVRDLGVISEVRLNEEAIASHFFVFGRDFVGEYIVGSGRESLRRYQVSSLFIRDGLEMARQRNVACLDLLSGEEPYKLRWTSKVVPNHRVILGRNRAFWGPYAGYRLLRSKARRYVEGESTPRWIKTALNPFRGHRPTSNSYGANRREDSGLK
jgi:CelD/BcsL family acetyltransferase involved in cellulose biosynthesis